MADALTDLRIRIVTCDRCDLHNHCRTPVPFNGPAEPRFLVVGEAPGRMEDYEGKPFVGPAGTLMRKTLRRVGLNPSDAVFMNVVCCWPHGTPEPEHLTACAIHLKDQLAAFSTRHVLLCGTTALRAILPSADLKFTMGRTFELYDKLFFTVWHPSYINRTFHLAPSWRTYLMNFALKVRLQDELSMTYSCVYCGAGVKADEQVCAKHLARWRRDINWPVYNAQQRLL